MSSSSRPRTNLELLTEGHKYVQKARKAKQEQVEEIKFDDEARREWLGGFHKRKKAKTEERRARAKERDRVAHREERRAAREELKKKAAENVRNVRMAMGLDATPNGEQHDDETDSGSEEEEERVVEDAYEDEDQIATVTIVEDFDPSQPGPSRRPLSPGSASEDGPRSKSENVADREKEKKRKAAGLPEMPASSRRAQKRAKSTHSSEKPKTEKRDRGMETKAERKFGRAVEAKRRAKKAHIALERDGRQRGADKGRRKGGKDKPKGRRK